MKNSNFLSISTRDVIKGFIVAVLTVVLTGVSTSLSSGTFPTINEIEHLALVGLGAGVAYLLKNLFTNSNDQFLIKEKNG